MAQSNPSAHGSAPKACEPLRLTFITSGLALGGAEAMLGKLLPTLSHAAKIYVISLTGAGYYGPLLQQAGIDVIPLNFAAVRGVLLQTGWHNLKQTLRLVRLIRQHRPQVVQTWMYHADLLGGIVAKIATFPHSSPPIVWGIRNSNLDATHTTASTRMVVRLLARLSTFIPNRILSCSRTAISVHQELGYVANKFHCLANGFDCRRFCPQPTAQAQINASLQLPANTPLVALFARFHPQKDHALFFAAARLIHAQRHEVHFILAGSGIDNSNMALNALLPSPDEPLRANIHLLGPRHDMPLLMSASRVLVQSSSYGEAFPNVLGEAMACGTPCVATAVGDTQYIIGEHGIVSPAGDARALSDGVLKILALSPTAYHQLGKQCRQHILKHYDLQRIGEQYLAFYREQARNEKAW